MRFRNDWRWLWNVTIGSTVLLLLAVALLACGKGVSEAPGAVPPSGAPTAVACGSALAAEDLSGQCRASPQATMGALEAVEG